MKLKDILDKEDISVYDAITIVKEVATLIQKTSESILLRNETVKDDTNRLMETVVKMGQQLQEAYNALDKQEVELCQQLDKAYERHRKAREALIRKFSQLPPLPDVSVPFGISGTLELAERCSQFTDEQWSRLIDLAKALQAK